ncbi:MAG: type III secretion system outer membrane ring subunit SctC [Deltaproteobacteria bacterium]|nr:type III secretion system outer membrane ring subunit SctC [Deltaproteobacteria bacterium]
MVFSGVLLLGLVAFAAGAPFTYYAEQEDLAVVLANFASSQGLSAVISPNLSGKVSGRFSGVPGKTFLDGMKAAFNVAWYQAGKTIYFYNESEMSRAFITPRALTVKQMMEALRRAEVFSPQLPPHFAANGAMIVVNGPPDYIAQIQNAAAALEETQMSTFEMKVFPLKHAWAEDITVDSMDKSVTIPGVASILQAMVSGTPSTGASRTSSLPATVDKLGGKGLASKGKSDSAAKTESSPEQEKAAPAGSGTSAASAVSIMADPRVNAVVVNDAAYRMPYYAKVIADLDKPVELVEIHAAIVDIDTNFKRDLGITYQGKNDRTGKGGWSTGGELSSSTETISELPASGILSGPGLSISTLYTHGMDYFLARVQALEEEGEARMLGRPSVLTADNIQATLENTSTYYIQVQGYETVDLFKVEAGTVLRVTPHIVHNHDGSLAIKLAVNVQDDQSNNDSSTLTTSSGVLPPIKQTKINTQATIATGQSLLIGGYSYEEKTVDENGIPVLMHIPYVGRLFKTTSKSTKRMERLILITPKVVHLDDLPAVPARLDEPTFRHTPTQADYHERTPEVRWGGGCARRSRLEGRP